MKIKLEYPYSEDWDHGYVVVNKEHRKTVILVNKNKKIKVQHLMLGI